MTATRLFRGPNAEEQLAEAADICCLRLLEKSFGEIVR